MKFLMILLTLTLSGEPGLYDFNIKTIDGSEISLSKFKGRKILIVNTASECGYTYQYEGLEKLSEAYKEKVVIIGFPANNFGQQEPGTNEEIHSFCKSTFNISFPMMSKVSVKGEDIAPLFKWLTSQENPDFTGDIQWNFEKFLIDENGKLVHRWRKKTEPMSDEITKAIEGN